MNVKFLLGCLALLLVGTAQAQPGLGLPPTMPFSATVPLMADPRLPLVPPLAASQKPSLTIRELQTYRGTIFQLEAVGQKRADIFRSLAAAEGKACAIDSRIGDYSVTFVVRGESLEELLTQVCENDVAIARDSAGLIIFEYSPFSVSKTLAGSHIPLDLIPVTPFPDPMNMNSEPLHKDKPDPQWGKVPFNGKEFYVVPLPTPEFRPLPRQ